LIYCFLRFRARSRAKLAIVVFVVLFAQHSTLRRATAQVSVQQSTPVNVVARPCKMLPVASKSSKETNKKSRGRLDDAGANTTSACLEVHFSALETQEYLQAYGRDQKWRMSGEHVAEDAWTFSRNLERAELLQYTKSDANTGRVNWTGGKAFLQVRTVELEGGFTRVQVIARFQGYGQSADRFAPPKESWPLDSNGSLESQLVSALESHLKAIH
jgi:hypothetical protein